MNVYNLSIDHTVELASLYSDVCSIARNGCLGLSKLVQTTSRLGRAAIGFAAGFYVVAIVGVPIGLRGMQRAWTQLQTDLQENHLTLGLAHGIDFSGSVLFTTYSFAASLYGIGVYAKNFALVGSAGAAFSVAAPFFFACIGASALYRFALNISFRMKLEEIAGKTEEERNQAFKAWLQEIRWDKRMLESWTSAPCTDLLRRVALRKFDLGSCEIESLIQEMRIANNEQFFKQFIYLCIATIGLSAIAAGPFAPLLYGIAAFLLWPLVDSKDLTHLASSKIEKLFFNRESKLPHARGGLLRFLERHQMAPEMSSQERMARRVQEASLLAWWARGDASAMTAREFPEQRSTFESPGEAARRGRGSEEKIDGEKIRRNFLKDVERSRYNVELNDKILSSDSGIHYIGDDNRSGKEWVGALVEELNKFFETEDDTYHFLDHFKVNNGLPQPIFPKLLSVSDERVEVMKNSEDPDQLFSLSMEGESRIRIVMQRRVEYAEIDRQAVESPTHSETYSARFEAVFNKSAECVDYSFTAIPLHNK
ncbi:MAG: hypothetical protein KGI80_03270 [Verrucomicrobiota bacterium]|nr:hypothetical protein [Verrucomicrobiota bacterium]